MDSVQQAADEAAMIALGAAAAETVADGTVIALVGDLGAGKTHWTKGFAAGLGCSGDATSPTFGIVHEYPGGRLPVRHFDFYRIASEAELIAIGWDEMLESPGVTIAEWADKFPALFPPRTVWLRFAIGPEGTRRVERLS